MIQYILSGIKIHSGNLAHAEMFRARGKHQNQIFYRDVSIAWWTSQSNISTEMFPVVNITIKYSTSLTCLTSWWISIIKVRRWWMWKTSQSNISTERFPVVNITIIIIIINITINITSAEMFPAVHITMSKISTKIFPVENIPLKD